MRQSFFDDQPETELLWPAGGHRLTLRIRHELPPKGIPEIFISYAWGDDSSGDARKRTEIVDRLCETLGQHGWHILRDSNVLRSGDLISGFMKRIGLADDVIVVLSGKYLRSPHCMTELYSIYQRSVGEKEDFLRRIIPLRLDDARFSNWRDRVAFAEYWEAEGIADDRAAMLPKYVSAASGSLDLPWSPATSTAPSVATSSNPKTSPTISSSPESSDTNSPDPKLTLSSSLPRSVTGTLDGPTLALVRGYEGKIRPLRPFTWRKNAANSIQWEERYPTRQLLHQPEAIGAWAAGRAS